MEPNVTVVSASPTFVTTTPCQALSINGQGGGTYSFTSMESYEEVFKEITKKLYGDEAEVVDQASVIYETDAFRSDVAFVANGALPPGTILVQRKLHQDKDGRWLWVDVPATEQQVAIVNSSEEQQAVHTTSPGFEERWFESDEVLNWTSSKIARYNPNQKVFRCVDCDFVGFLSRVAEHWLGNHASLRVFQCPRCPYTSAWARCVRMHLSKQHGESHPESNFWKENPVLEEYKSQVTRFLTTLKTRVEAEKVENSAGGEKRYLCPYCPYATDRRDLFNRHENIHREEKPFQCYVCDKQFNRADHVKKHFTRMHRDHTYDIQKIKKMKPTPVVQKIKTEPGTVIVPTTEVPQSPSTTVSTEAISLHLDNQSVTVQQIPHIAYFNPPTNPGQSGPLQGIAGVGGTKKESKTKGQKKKKAGEKMFTCSYCPWQGVDNWCLKRHLNTHIKPFLCALCDYKAARSERLATHVLKVHNKRVCHKCSFLADDTDSLSQHIQESHQNPLVKTGYNCNVCQEYFELRADLEAHAILEHQKVIVQCDLCDFRTTDEVSMESHLREKHNLQPGMGAVAAAAAAAAAAAGNQPNGGPFMHVTSQPQIADPLSLEAELDRQNLLLTPDQLNQSNIAATVAAVAAGTEAISFQHDSTGNLIPKIEPGILTNEGLSEDSSHTLMEPEPETICEKCGVEFADEASLKLHERRHEGKAPSKDTVPSSKSSATKGLVRSYVCSTCSYTASTKRIMMQHQRAHNGLELVCKAEGCLFSTPFDNTLKEHILTDHGNEPNVRCPHCGLRVPSTNAFTYHWRAHHSTLCSLCVNLYRIKYGIKENVLLDLVKKPMIELLNEDLLSKPKPVIQIQESEKNDSDDKTVNTVQQEALQDLECLGLNNNEYQPPPSKKMKFELNFSPILESLERKRTRSSLKIIPVMTEVLVTPVISEKHLRTIVKRSNSNSVVPLVKRYRKFLKRRRWKRSLLSPRLLPFRRYLMRGTTPWLLRHLASRKGTRCYKSQCMDRFRHTRKIGKILHQRWLHTKPIHRCDVCSQRFVYLYQAVLHRMLQHRKHRQLPSTTGSQSQQVVDQYQSAQHDIIMMDGHGSFSSDMQMSNMIEVSRTPL